jgi:hypothetical protein
LSSISNSSSGAWAMLFLNSLIFASLYMINSMRDLRIFIVNSVNISLKFSTLNYSKTAFTYYSISGSTVLKQVRIILGLGNNHQVEIRVFEWLFGIRILLENQFQFFKRRFNAQFYDKIIKHLWMNFREQLGIIGCRGHLFALSPKSWKRPANWNPILTPVNAFLLQSLEVARFTLKIAWIRWNIPNKNR